MSKKKKVETSRKQKKMNKKKQMLSKNKEVDMEQLVKEHNAKALKEYISGNRPVFFINSYYKQKEGDIKDERASMYRPFCNEEEISRILNVNSAEDYLLKIRADAVFNKPRIHRVIIQRQKKLKEQWNFTNHFSKNEFNYCLDLLPDDDKLRLSNVAMGFIFTNEPNGACMRTDYGNIIVVSESLRYFLFFMNLCFIKFDSGEVPPDVEITALTIAIRTMLETESLDFELDPRGIIPDEIELENNETVKRQLQFVISHEFAHHLLGHLDKNCIAERNLFRSFKADNTKEQYKFYNNTQQQEFEADLEAILRLNFQHEWEFEEMVQNAIMFFIYLDVYEKVSNQISPPISYYRTHPDPIDRVWNIYEAVKDRVSFDKSTIDRVLTFAETTKQYLEKDVAYNIEKYETYGSVYLGQWRGQVRIDRIDY
jgi:hypothetical protein